MLIAAYIVLASGDILRPEQFKHYVDEFNARDNDLYSQAISNNQAWEFMKENIPLFTCPDQQLERTYYFRWWTYRKHLKQTPDGWVVTEFLPKVPWSRKHNTINCPAGHQFYEGRWLHNARYLQDYARFYFGGGGSPRQYSFWAADSIAAFEAVHPDDSFMSDLLPKLVRNYEGWEAERQADDGLYWQNDGLDGMEVSIGGSGKRATINSYQYGDARAIEKLATRFGETSTAKAFKEKAERLRALTLQTLWDEEAQFFKVLPNTPDAKLSDARELHGYTPWAFGLPIPGDGRDEAWRHLTDTQGFAAPFGPTTVEQRHKGFSVSYQGHECQWNGPSWPFATTMTLKSLARTLREYAPTSVDKSDYFELLQTYAKSHQRKLEDGTIVPWIDENLDPMTGAWLARTRLESWTPEGWSAEKGGVERGKDYNHSGFCDLVISDLVGIRANSSDWLVIDPLVPAGTWDWFALDNVLYRGHTIAVVWDRDGTKFGKGRGFSVFVDGELRKTSPRLDRLVIRFSSN